MIRRGWIAAALLLCACGGPGKKPADEEVLPTRQITLTDSVLRAAVADTLDFGRVHPGESLERRITLRNGSDKPVVILEVETVCGCTEVDFPRKPIAPGQAGVMTIKFHAGGLDSGPQFKPVALRTSLGGGRYRVIVTADVQ